MPVTRGQAALLKKGGVMVMPTDTIYGLVGQALSMRTIERLYQVKKRAPAKPFIILIGALSDLASFGVHLSAAQSRFCERVWPGKVSIVLPCKAAKFAYLHRGSRSLAFRMPQHRWLRSLLKRTGPLVAPSANPEGLPPARNLKEAKAYFGDHIDGYIAGGRMASSASTLVSLLGPQPVILRPGAVTIDL